MRYSLLTRRNLLLFATVALVVSLGCGSTSNTLPSTIVIELPDGTTTEAEQGAGVPSLANSEWDFVRTSATGQSVSFVRIVFNANGGVDRFVESTIASEIFGDEIIFDGERRETNQQGIQYAATVYGAGTDDGTGFAFDARLTAHLGDFVVGLGAASATGTFAPGDPDVITGTFAFSSQLTVPLDIPGAEQNDEFPFRATRVIQ